MNQCSAIARYLLVVFVVLAVGAPVEAAKKIKEKSYKGQAGYLFVNHEPEEAQGLVVQLSKKAFVVTDASTGFAGPFQNIRGNGTASIAFSHARPPIAPATSDDGGIDLAFRSYKSGLKIKGYYWTNAEGKRIGKKHSP